MILQSSSEGIFGVDTDGAITFVNPAACRMLGYTPEEMIGQPSHALIHHRRPDGGEYPVEQCPMFAAYKRGVALSAFCQRTLEDAELQIKVLENGSLRDFKPEGRSGDA